MRGCDFSGLRLKLKGAGSMLLHYLAYDVGTCFRGVLDM